MRTVLSLALAATAVAGFAQRMERGSFLVRPAKSLSHNIRLMELNPGVARRYTEHYGFSQSMVKRYLSSLKPSRIPATGKYYVYGWHPDGVRGSMQTLQKGEVVYKDSLGRFALRGQCGNPMTSGVQARAAMPQEEELVAERPVKAATNESEEVVNTNTTVVEETKTVETTVLPPTEPVVQPVVTETTTQVTTAVEQPIQVVDTTATTTVTNPAPVVASSGGSNALPYILGAAAIAGIAIAANQSSSDSLPVPEPASMAVLGLGIAALRRRRNRK